MSRKTIIISFLMLITVSILFISLSCSDQDKKLTIKIDWVPSAEYYGIFYAKYKKLFDKAGYNVEIQKGQGAPVVAKELAVGAVNIGTTSSENILRQIKEGAEFSLVAPLLKFNPSVIVSLADNPIHNLEDLIGKRLGCKKDTFPYKQYLLAMSNQKLDHEKVEEVPVGWGGKEFLLNNQTDAVLHYVTNLYVDLKVAKHNPVKLMLSDFGLHSFGTVLAFGTSKKNDKRLSQEQKEEIAKIVLKGYDAAKNDIEGCIEALKKADPQLKSNKLKASINLIKEMNRITNATIYNIDQSIDISTDKRKYFEDLFMETNN